jgi:hypothetical protein
MNLIITIVIIGVCMGIMAIGLILKGKAVCKDCGLDPVSGERIGHCHCADEGDEPEESRCESGGADGRVVQLPQRGLALLNHLCLPC